MDVELYRRAQAVFDVVIELPPHERAAAIDAACGDDTALQALVEELLELESEGTGGSMESIAAAAAAAELPVALQPGVQVHQYVVLRLLGRGGTAQVWEVMHRVLGSRHALKVLTWADPGLQRRLLREARAQATLVHPNIVPVHDIIEVHGAPGLLMPAIDGPALDELLSDYTPTLEEALTVFTGVVAGVAHAHAEGLTHRDLKPGNVLVDLRAREVVPRVTDFGLVKGGRERTATLPGQVMGTLSYAAPEQLRATEDIDARADLWSLGVMLVELVSGTRLFRGRVVEDILALHASHAAAEVVPPVLRPVVERLLQVDPADRAPSCAWILENLPPFEPTYGPGLLAACRSHARPPLKPSQMTRDLRTLSAVLTAAPAAPELLPEPLVSPALDATIQQSPPRSRWTPLLAGLGLFGLVVVGGVAVWSPAGPPGVTKPAAVDVPTAAPVEPAVDPTPGPEALEADAPADVPSVVDAVPAPEPPEATPRPAPSRPRPAGPPKQAASPASEPARPPPSPPEAEPQPVPAPVPALEPAPEPEPAPGYVVVTGDATKVVLSSGGRTFPPGSVPAGTYSARASFEGREGSTKMSLGPVAAGQRITIHCSERFGSCKVQGR